MDAEGMKRILVDIATEETGLQGLRALPGVVVETVETAKAARALPAELLREQHILVCKTPPLNFDDLHSLEFMQISTVGYEHLRHLGLAHKSIRVCNARGVFDTAIAEWSLAMMINLRRDLRELIRQQEQGEWHRASRFQQEVRGRVVGLWGYGGIGRETARLAKAFGMTVHVLARSRVGPRATAYTLNGTGDPEGILPDRVYFPGQ